MTPPIQAEAEQLIAGRVPANIQSARDLATLFIAERLANARAAEHVKQTAVAKILEKLSNGEEVSMTRLLAIFSEMSSITATDLTLLAGGGGNGRPAAGVLDSFIDAVHGQPAPAPVSRTTYQLIEALDSIAGEVVAQPAATAEPTPAH